MIVPDHWAEVRKQHRDAQQQFTVRRFGWSTISQADAADMAERRATEALARILAGEKLDRREPKTAYNGASGVPIREEVLLRQGDEVITRNAYGARCLNTPRALFADVDLSDVGKPGRAGLHVLAALAVLSVAVGVYSRSVGVAFAALFLSVLIAFPAAWLLSRLVLAVGGGPARIVRRRIHAFLARHPEWNLRLYETPAGLRLLATHRTFDAAAPEVHQFFKAVGADPVYVRMSLNQHCFRARLTAKPWRIGISSHMRPRPGVWPVDPDRIHLRKQWVDKYEETASAYAACRYLESLGSGAVHIDIKGVIDLHDRESRAGERHLPVA